VGSTPTRPISGIGDWRLAIADCRLRHWGTRGHAARSITEQRAIGNCQSEMPLAREAQMAKHSIGNREVASSIPAAGSEVKVMAKILPIITQTRRERYAAWRMRALVRQLAVIKRKSLSGSIAQTAERTPHKGEGGGSIPPRATRSMRRSQAGKAPGC
jgi:hypothetical protein